MDQGNEWRVGLENILAMQLLDRYPREGLPIERLRCATEGVDIVEVQPHPSILVVMVERQGEAGRTDIDAELLAQFAL